MDIHELLLLTISRNASDLHLIAAHSPCMRINGELHTLVTFPKLTPLEIEQMIYSIINGKQKEVLVTNRELDFSTTINSNDKETVRFRVNAYYQKGSLAASFRLIPPKIKTIEQLRLPAILHEFTKLRQGFILITGATGQGKSATIASMIAEINVTRTAHIITIENPIEYVYPSGKCIISQREMYQDTHSWNIALKNVLREDPDIVFIGEMRDLETVNSVLTIAETGHLVISSLHTKTAPQSIDRIVDIFPPVARDQVRMQLSMVISGIVTQHLLPTVAGDRIPVCEILLGTNSVKNTIRDGRTYLLDNVLQTSKDQGMMLFEDNLKNLVEQNIISHETALEYAFRPDRYLELMKG